MGSGALDLALLPRPVLAKVPQMPQKHPDPSGDLTSESPRPFRVLHARYLQCLPPPLG